MRIVDWNLARKLKALDHLESVLEPDIALLQEFPPNGVERFNEGELLFSCIDERGRKENWGSAIYSKVGIEKVELPTEYKGSMIAGVTELANGDLIGLLNIYGLLEKVGENQSKKIVWLGVHRMISDAGIWLGGYAGPKVKYMIVAGDFNNDRQMDTHRTFAKHGRRPSGLLLDRFSDFGLIELLPEFFDKPVQTHRHIKSDFPWQLDHVFVNQQTLKRIKKVEVLASESVIEVSDHNPIVVELDL